MTTEQQNKTISDQLAARKYNPDIIPEKQPVVYTVGGSICGTLGNLCVITGMPKVGKSTITAGLIASAFNMYDIFGCKLTFPPGRRGLAYFDTETAPYDFYAQIERFKQFAERNTTPEYLHAYNFREDAPETILKLIEHHFQNIDTPIAIIDGLLDLIYDFNDAVQSKNLINTLKRWGKVYNCLIIVILHQGKNTNGNTLGHLGSMTDRYCQSTIEIQRDNNTLTIAPKLLRSDKYFNPIHIVINNGNYIVEQSEETEKTDDIGELARQIIQPVNDYETLVNTVAEYTGKSKASAKKIVRAWITGGYITKDGDKYVKTRSLN
jgi:RecA-family ATPase